MLKQIENFMLYCRDYKGYIDIGFYGGIWSGNDDEV